MNNKMILTFLLCWLGYFAFAQESKMSNAEIEKFKAQLAQVDKINTLEAEFTQHKKVGYVKDEAISTGKFYVDNPNRLAWHYDAPMDYSMVFKDKKIFINNKGKKRNMDLSRNKQFERISQAIQANMNTGDYKNSEMTPSYFQNATHYILKLDPVGRNAKRALQQLVLYFDKKNYKMNEFLLVEGDNAYTRFVLRNQKINQGLSDTVFAH